MSEPLNIEEATGGAVASNDQLGIHSWWTKEMIDSLIMASFKAQSEMTIILTERDAAQTICSAQRAIEILATATSPLVAA